MLRRHLGSAVALALGLTCFACSSSDDGGSENNAGGGGTAGAAGQAGVGAQSGAAGVAGTGGSDPYQPVQFTDAALEQCVRTALAMPDGDIYPDAFAGLQHLGCLDAGITNVIGLEHAGALIDLSLFENEIVDITPLAGLTQLRDLQLGNNLIQDISPLSGLTSLRRLGLVDNQIASLQPLAGLTTLEWLNLDRNAFGEGELVHLTGLTNLRWLTIEHNGITNESALQPLVDAGCQLYHEFYANMSMQTGELTAPASQLSHPRANLANLRVTLGNTGAISMRYDLDGKLLRVSQPAGKPVISGTRVVLPVAGKNVQVGKVVERQPVLCEGELSNVCEVVIGMKWPSAGPNKSTDPYVSVTVDLIDPPRTVLLDGEDWTQVVNNLDPYTLASPDQYDAGSCLNMSNTGAMEILMNQHVPLEDITYNGDTDLSERFLMSAFYDTTTDQVPYMLSDLIYTFEAFGGALLSRDYNFCMGYCVDDANGYPSPAEKTDAGAYLTASYNWFDMKPDNWQSLLVQTPLVDRTVIYVDPKRDDESWWRIALMNDDIIERIKYELRVKNAPVVTVFNLHGWWHSNVIIGYDDTIPYNGCDYLEDAKQDFKDAGLSAYASQIDAHVAQEGCSENGVFYVRDSIYTGGSSEEYYDYSWGAYSWLPEKYSKRVLKQPYDWAKHLANHAYTVHRR